MKNTVKKWALGWSLLAVLLMMDACKEAFLEQPPTGSLNQQLLSTGAGLEASLIAVYSQVNGRANRMASPSNWVWGSIRGGEANKGTDPGDFSDINPIQRFEALPTQGVINDKWNGNYEGVARANGTLRLLPLTEAVTTAQVAQKLSVEAQAKFLRAHFYFELKRAFNDTPYVDENIDVVGGGVDTGIEKVKNDQDLWPKIEADMLFAYNNLPETQSQAGRVNKWAAAAYLAKIYMYQHKFAEAKALYDQIIPNGKTSNGLAYDLLPKYADAFKASLDNSAESVWAYQSASGTGSVNNANPEFDLNWPYNTGPDGPGNCCSFFQPTFELGNSFRTTAGGLPMFDGSYNLPANELVTDMGLESKDAFTPDAGPVDPRLDHSIGRRYIQYLDWMPFPGKAWIRNQPNAGPYETKKFAYYKADKGTLQDNSSWTPGYTAINYNIIRFADVLLMAAEAEIEAGTLAQAMTYTNRVRQRAMNPAGFVMGKLTGFTGGDFTKPITDPTLPAANYVISLYTAAQFTDQATARTTVRFERKLELSGEGHRFFDFNRWGTTTTDVTNYLTYEIPKYPSGALTGAKFDEGKDEFLPMPQPQVDLLGPDVLKQNPGF